ncbi:hypothetical protein BGZ58_001098 [Dissophora ornata]|nr:hypothetical protein BGZ58_001098 [Dissophora ornata]
MTPQLVLLAVILAILSLLAPAVDAALAVRINATTTVNYRSWDPYQGESDYYSLPGILVMGQVQTDCTVQVDSAAGPAGQAIMAAVDPLNPIVDTILVLPYDWLNWCATFDVIFDNLGSLNTQLQNLTLPKVGAVVMDGNALSTEDFGAPFNQVEDAKYWNQDVRLNISFMGTDDVALVSTFLAANNHSLLATVAQDEGPWNRLWHSIGFNIAIRGLDILAGLTFIYGLWVLAFIVQAPKESQHYRRYMILIPGCLFLPLSIAFAPYKVTVPWRNTLYYVSLLLPFISLGLQITMWGNLIYRIKRKKVNRVFAYFSYITIFIPVVSSFLDGIGWLIPSIPTIRIIGEQGFSYATPVVIILQAILIFYYAATFFKSLKTVAVSQTTRTALVMITVLNLAMISFFILMLLSRIVSLLGLNMKSRSAYVTELVIFRFSFLFFYACCFRTLSIRQPSGSTVDSKDTSNPGQGNNANKNSAKNHTHYPMDSFSNDPSRDNQNDDSKPSLHYNKHLSNHASKGFTISDPSSPSSYKTPSYGGATSSPKLTHGYATSKQQLLHPDSVDYPDPYKFNEFGHLSNGESMPIPGEGNGALRDTYVDIGLEDKDSVYGSHRFQGSPLPDNSHAANGGRVVGGKARNSEGYSQFDVSGEDHSSQVV